MSEPIRPAVLVPDICMLASFNEEKVNYYLSFWPGSVSRKSRKTKRAARGELYPSYDFRSRSFRVVVAKSLALRSGTSCPSGQRWPTSGGTSGSTRRPRLCKLRLETGPRLATRRHNWKGRERPWTRQPPGLVTTLDLAPS